MLRIDGPHKIVTTQFFRHLDIRVPKKLLLHGDNAYVYTTFHFPVLGVNNGRDFSICKYVTLWSQFVPPMPKSHVTDRRPGCVESILLSS